VGPERGEQQSLVGVDRRPNAQKMAELQQQRRGPARTDLSPADALFGPAPAPAPAAPAAPPPELDRRERVALSRASAMIREIYDSAGDFAVHRAGATVGETDLTWSQWPALTDWRAWARPADGSPIQPTWDRVTADPAKVTSSANANGLLETWRSACARAPLPEVLDLVGVPEAHASGGVPLESWLTPLAHAIRRSPHGTVLVVRDNPGIVERILRAVPAERAPTPAPTPAPAPARQDPRPPAPPLPPDPLADFPGDPDVPPLPEGLDPKVVSRHLKRAEVLIQHGNPQAALDLLTEIGPRDLPWSTVRATLPAEHVALLESLPASASAVVVTFEPGVGVSLSGPTRQHKDAIKASRKFRWSPKQKLWYAPQSRQATPATVQALAEALRAHGVPTHVSASPGTPASIDVAIPASLARAPAPSAPSAKAWLHAQKANASSNPFPLVRSATEEHGATFGREVALQLRQLGARLTSAEGTRTVSQVVAEQLFKRSNASPWSWQTPNIIGENRIDPPPPVRGGMHSGPELSGFIRAFTQLPLARQAVKEAEKFERSLERFPLEQRKRIRKAEEYLGTEERNAVETAKNALFRWAAEPVSWPAKPTLRDFNRARDYFLGHAKHLVTLYSSASEPTLYYVDPNDDEGLDSIAALLCMRELPSFLRGLLTEYYGIDDRAYDEDGKLVHLETCSGDKPAFDARKHRAVLTAADAREAARQADSLQREIADARALKAIFDAVSATSGGKPITVDQLNREYKRRHPDAWQPANGDVNDRRFRWINRGSTSTLSPQSLYVRGPGGYGFGPGNLRGKSEPQLIAGILRDIEASLTKAGPEPAIVEQPKPTRQTPAVMPAKPKPAKPAKPTVPRKVQPEITPPSMFGTKIREIVEAAAPWIPVMASSHRFELHGYTLEQLRNFALSQGWILAEGSQYDPRYKISGAVSVWEQWADEPHHARIGLGVDWDRRVSLRDHLDGTMEFQLPPYLKNPSEIPSWRAAINLAVEADELDNRRKFGAKLPDLSHGRFQGLGDDESDNAIGSIRHRLSSPAPATAAPATAPATAPTPRTPPGGATTPAKLEMATQYGSLPGYERPVAVHYQQPRNTNDEHARRWNYGADVANRAFLTANPHLRPDLDEAGIAAVEEQIRKHTMGADGSGADDTIIRAITLGRDNLVRGTTPGTQTLTFDVSVASFVRDLQAAFRQAFPAQPDTAFSSRVESWSGMRRLLIFMRLDALNGSKFEIESAVRPDPKDPNPRTVDDSNGILASLLSVQILDGQQLRPDPRTPVATALPPVDTGWKNTRGTPADVLQALIQYLNHARQLLAQAPAPAPAPSAPAPAPSVAQMKAAVRETANERRRTKAAEKRAAETAKREAANERRRERLAKQKADAELAKTTAAEKRAAKQTQRELAKQTKQTQRELTKLEQAERRRAAQDARRSAKPSQGKAGKKPPRGYARTEYTDRVTGDFVPAQSWDSKPTREPYFASRPPIGTTADGRRRNGPLVRIGVEPRDLDPIHDLRAISDDAIPRYRELALADAQARLAILELPAIKPDGSIRWAALGLPETYASPDAALDLLLDDPGNENLDLSEWWAAGGRRQGSSAQVPESRDRLRDFANANLGHFGRGKRRKWVPFLDTARGRQIFEIDPNSKQTALWQPTNPDRFRSFRSSDAIFRDLAKYILGQNTSRRWDRVDWATLDRLAEAHGDVDQGPRIQEFTKPLQSGLASADEILGQMSARDLPDPAALEELRRQVNGRMLHALAARLSTSIARARSEKLWTLLPSPARTTILRRLATLTRWGAHPELVPYETCEASSSQVDRDGHVCTYARIRNDVTRLVEAIDGREPNRYLSAVEDEIRPDYDDTGLFPDDEIPF
jgi:hypothetical protein